MKHIDLFEKFLKDTVNLNKTRVETAASGIDIITSFLKAGELTKNLFVSTSPQGSYRQKTIIKPPAKDIEFDVDLLFEMKVVEGWEPKDYHKRVADQFRISDRYENNVDTRGKCRCVTIDYESDFHIDVVPAIHTQNGLHIINKNTNTFEPTDGDGYANWFEARSVIAQGFLVEVVRLVKYIRDTRQKFNIKSILLTTMLGNLVFETDNPDTYSNLPASLKILLNRLDAYLQTNVTMPVVTNPMLPTESFNRHWDQEKYNLFKKAIQTLNEQINDAYDEQDETESVEKWQLIFGDDFSSLKDDIEDKTGKSVALGNTGHAQTPPWPLNLLYKVKINAFVYIKPGNQWKFLGGINSDGRLLQNDLCLKYKAKTNAPLPYTVKWQVVNTGTHAEKENGLRGNFFDGKLYDNTLSPIPMINWEHTKYTGKHWIECFIVKDEKCIARSGKFFVNIKNSAYY